MTTSDLDRPEAASGAYDGPGALISLALLALLLSAVLLLPDALLAWHGIDLNGLTRLSNLSTVLGIAAVIAAMASRRARLEALAFLVLNQIVWIGCAVYFGRTLGPEQLLLAQYETGDTAIGALAEWRSLLPAVLCVLAAGGVGAALLWPDHRSRVWRSPAAAWVFLAALAGGATFWSLHKRIEVVFPGSDTPSAYGTYQALVSVVRLASTAVSAAHGMDVRDQAVATAPIDEEPVTVAVIMGESINAYRLQVLGFPSETTPRLAAWLDAPPDGFTFIPRVGISGGTATFGSMPTFLRMAYLPVGGERRGLNLFDLAEKNGFKSWFLSAQHRQFLDIAGGAKAAVRIESESGNGNEARLAARHDDMLVDFLAEVPEGPRRRFIFLHQRVNHAGYSVHCPHVAEAEGMYVFEDRSGTTAGRRRADYDNGLRCWDRNTTALASLLTGKKGAVHIFIMADHNELMGEDGLWGHGFPDVRSATVPMMLLTNRPNSRVAEAFRRTGPLTTYRMSQTVALAMGFEIGTPGIPDNRYFLNSTMPFGLAGYMQVDRLAPGKYRVTSFARNARKLGVKDLDMPELETGRVTNTLVSERKAGS